MSDRGEPNVLDMVEPNIKLCLFNSQRISDIYVAIKENGNKNTQELTHLREIILRDILHNREIFIKDLEVITEKIRKEEEVNEKVTGEFKAMAVALRADTNKFYKKVSEWALWALGALFVAIIGFILK